MSADHKKSADVKNIGSSPLPKKDQSRNNSPHRSLNKSFGSLDSPGVRKLDFVETFYPDRAPSITSSIESIPFLDGKKNKDFLNPTYRSTAEFTRTYNIRLEKLEDSGHKPSKESLFKLESGAGSPDGKDSPLPHRRNQSAVSYNNQEMSKSDPGLAHNSESYQTDQADFGQQVSPTQLNQSFPAHNNNNQKKISFASPEINEFESGYVHNTPKNPPNTASDRKDSVRIITTNNINSGRSLNNTSQSLGQESFKSQQKLITVMRKLDPTVVKPKKKEKVKESRNQPVEQKPFKIFNPKYIPKTIETCNILTYEEQQQKRVALQQMARENVRRLNAEEAQHKERLYHELSIISEVKNEFASINTDPNTSVASKKNRASSSFVVNQQSNQSIQVISSQIFKNSLTGKMIIDFTVK